MDSFLICSVLLFFMFTGGQSVSFSRSCTMVNGRQECTTDESNGNSAMSSSQAGTGTGGSYSSNYAGTGNTGTGTWNSVRSQSGNPPPSGFAFMPMPGMGMPGGFAGAYAGAGNLPFNPFAFVNQFGFGRR